MGGPQCHFKYESYCHIVACNLIEYFFNCHILFIKVLHKIFNVVDFFTDDFLMDCKTTCAINVILLIRFQHPNRFVEKVKKQHRFK